MTPDVSRALLANVSSVTEWRLDPRVIGKSWLRAERKNVRSVLDGQRGFTLIEILVVIVIVGVLVTFATLSMGNRALDDRMEVEAKRLLELFKLASEEAEIKGVEIGFSAGLNGYQFLARDEEGAWQAYTSAGPLRPREISAPFELSMRVEGQTVPPANFQASAEGNEAQKLRPQALLLSSGEATAFTLDVLAPGYGASYRIEADPLARLTLARQDAPR